LPEPKHVSRRRIGRLMKGLGLVSNYTVAQYKLHHSTCNEAPIKNELQRQFEQEEPLAVIVSDLTYVRVGTKWQTEFANGAHFSTLEQLALELDDTVHWFNNI
ncbi:IS3 family transposase, partial [Lysinibacillus sp. VIII_CA]|uniref:IS3 family transposase n=1 Tax=Lysinibacillus sp. VIII_CA TaxID=3417452 RepID=UPI003CEF86AC